MNQPPNLKITIENEKKQHYLALVLIGVMCLLIASSLTTYNLSNDVLLKQHNIEGSNIDIKSLINVLNGLRLGLICYLLLYLSAAKIKALRGLSVTFPGAILLFSAAYALTLMVADDSSHLYYTIAMLCVSTFILIPVKQSVTLYATMLIIMIIGIAMIVQNIGIVRVSITNVLTFSIIFFYISKKNYQSKLNELLLLEELESDNRVLKQAVQVDGLTKIPNRAHFDKQLNRYKDQDAPLSLILIDIDFFKPYNDGYGHPQGDVCLREVAKTLSRSLKRDMDAAFRYGGEEFAVILPGTFEEGAMTTAERLRIAISDLRIKHEHRSLGEKIVTISVGVACSNGRYDPTDLLKLSDEMLYKSKENGRNRTSLSVLQTPQP